MAKVLSPNNRFPFCIFVCIDQFPAFVVSRTVRFEIVNGVTVCVFPEAKTVPGRTSCQIWFVYFINEGAFNSKSGRCVKEMVGQDVLFEHKFRLFCKEPPWSAA